METVLVEIEFKDAPVQFEVIQLTPSSVALEELNRLEAKYPDATIFIF